VYRFFRGVRGPRGECAHVSDVRQTMVSVMTTFPATIRDSNMSRGIRVSRAGATLPGGDRFDFTGPIPSTPDTW
jgi:hypothetical protein